MDILGQSTLLVGATSFALGSSTLARNVKNKLNLAFAGVCTLIALWALAFFFAKVWPELGFYRWHLLFNAWMGPAALAFIRVFLRHQDWPSQVLVVASTAFAIFLTLALAVGWERDQVILTCIYFAPALIVPQLLRLMWIDFRLKSGVSRNFKPPTVGVAKKNMIYLGAFFVLMTSTLDHVSILGKIVPSIGNLALTAYLFFISRAITQQRLMHFSAMLSQFLVLVGVALILTACYSVLVAWISDSPALFFLNSFLASFFILTMLEPIRAVVRYLTHRLLSQEHRRLEQDLREAQRELAAIVDMHSLFQALNRVVKRTLDAQWAAIFSLSSDGSQYRRLRSDGEVPAGVTILEMLPGHPLLQYCERLHSRNQLPVVLDQMIESEIDRSASRSQRESLSALRQSLTGMGGNILIPLYDGDQMMGFVVVYAPVPPEFWGNNWGMLPVIYPYFEQAAQTLRNLDVYVKMREKERLAALGEMAAGLAHEIRNPLGAIKGAAQYLDPSTDRPESKFLAVIVEEVDRLNRVVTQFLDYSKPHAVELKIVDASLLARKTIEFLRAGLPQEIQLEFKPWSEALPIKGSPEQFQQVLINLIQNSCKALESRPNPRIQIEVSLNRTFSHDEVQITIEDNGPGIKKENLDKIFIPFFTTSPSGTGLGLPICQKIIEAHQGSIEVVSEEGRFTRVSVNLPLAQERAVEVGSA